MRAIYYYQGLDTSNANFGSNIFKSYLTRITEDGFYLGSGNKVTCMNGVLQLSYEFRQNLYFETGVQYRYYHETVGNKTSNQLMYSVGLRLNVFKREYDF